MDRFYFKTKAGVHGPVTFKELLAKLRQGHFSLEDHVRMDGSNNWLRAETVMKSLMTRYPEIATAAVSQDLNKQETGRSAREEKDRIHSYRLPLYSLISWFGTIGSTVSETFMQAVAGVTTSMLTPFTKVSRRQWATVGVVATWITINVLVFQSLRPAFEREAGYYSAMNEVWGEFQDLRESKATEHEWEQFQKTAVLRIESIANDLNRTATPEHEIQMQLLWASREYLPKMLTDSRREPSNSESLFKTHMQRSAELLRQNGQNVSSL